MLLRAIPLSLAALLAVLAPGAGAAEVPSLPAVERTISASGVSATPCKAVTRRGRGVGSAWYGAPMSGWVSYRLSGRGDWDLQVLDAQRRGIGASQSFGGQELVQGWVDA